MTTNYGKRIAIGNNKGGVGKTTTCVTLATETALLGNEVLIIDLDPQGDSSKMFDRYENTEKTTIDLFKLKGKDVTKENVKECIYATEYEGIDIIPCNEDFSLTLDEIFIDVSRQQQLILKKALKTVEDEYDYIFIDTPGYFNIVTRNALSYADEVIVPIENDGFSFNSLMKLLNKLEEIKEEFNPNLNLRGVFVAKANNVTTLYKQMIESYKEVLGDKFIDSYIRENNKMRETTTVYEPISFYQPKSEVATDYRLLLRNLHILDSESQQKIEHKINEVIKDLKKKVKEEKSKLKEAKTSNNESTVKRLESSIKSKMKEIERMEI